MLTSLLFSRPSVLLLHCSSSFQLSSTNLGCLLIAAPCSHWHTSSYQELAYFRFNSFQLLIDAFLPGHHFFSVCLFQAWACPLVLPCPFRCHFFHLVQLHIPLLALRLLIAGKGQVYWSFHKLCYLPVQANWLTFLQCFWFFYVLQITKVILCASIGDKNVSII